MKTEKKFVDTLKLLMETEPLEEITVSSLSKKCKVKRQTFYYHFHDMYDLLMVSYLYEEIPGINDVKSFEGLIEAIYKYYDQNRHFVDGTIDSACKDLFVEFIQNNSYQVLLRLIDNVPNSKGLTTHEKRAIARYHAFGVSNVVTIYINDHKNITLIDLKKQFVFLEEGFIENSINQVLSKIPKKSKK
ncbi:MAG: hypothetical protein LUD22_01370 [Coprobacillus sp.]|nr:hypothetical protein [Coprobacillus sp.]